MDRSHFTLPWPARSAAVLRPRPRRPWLAAVALGLTALSLLGHLSSWASADTPTAVTITATPKWGVSRAGAWTPYTVTLHNGGDADIDGEVLLIARPEPPPKPGAAPTTTTLPPVSTSTTVLAVGGRALTSPPPPGNAAPAGKPRWPTYRASVSLPGGTDKTLTIMVLEAPFGYAPELHDGDGRRVKATDSTEPTEETDPKDPRRQEAKLLLLSTVTDADDTLGALPPTIFRSKLNVIQMPSGSNFPDNALHLAGLDAVVMDDFDPGTLTPAQLRALQDYVSLGGSLVITGGAAGPRMLKLMPAGLSPLRATGTMTTSLMPLVDLVAEVTTATASIVTGDVVGGRVALAAVGGPPLVVESDYGFGRVVQMAYDPLAEPIAADPVLSSLAWEQGLSRVSFRYGTASTFSSGGLGAQLSEDQLWAPTLAKPTWPSWPGWALKLLVLYTVVAGLAIFLPSRRRRSALAWTALPLVVVVTAASCLLASGGRQDAAQTAVEVRTVGADGAVLKTTYRGLVALDPQGRVGVGRGAAASTLYSDQPVFSAARVGAVLDPMSPPPPVPPGLGGGVVEAIGASPAVELPTRPWALRTAQTVSIDDNGPAIEATLRLVGSSKESPGRITGTVTNLGSEPLRELRAHIPEGQARLPARLAPGETVEVDVPVLIIAATDAAGGGVGGGTGAGASKLLPATPEDVALAAVGSRSFTAPGQVAIVGVSDPPTASDGHTHRVAVVVTVVALRGAETVVASTGMGRTVGSLENAGVVSLASTEVMVLPGTGLLSLRYSAAITFPGQPPPPPSSAEVYNWTTGAWRSLPTVGHPNFAWVDAPVEEAEVNEGVVRVRQRGRFPGAQLLLRRDSEETEAALAPLFPK